MKPDPSACCVYTSGQALREDFEPLIQWAVLSLISDISWRHGDNTLGNSDKTDSVLHFAKLLSV